jgi:hypothetical protein
MRGKWVKREREEGKLKEEQRNEDRFSHQLL